MPLTADFFGPGSDPFTGDVDLKGMCAVAGCGGCDNDCDGPHSHLDFTEGVPTETIPIDMAYTDITLRSIDPVTVNVGGTLTSFDVRILLSGDLGASTPGEFSLPLGTVLDRGVTTYVIDSFLGGSAS